jgi:hypothetical protein
MPSAVRPRPHPVPPVVAAVAALLALPLAAVLGGCDLVEKAKPRERTTRASDPGFRLDVEPIMRGTIASETVMVGFQDTVVRGYGLVVGLDGTGSRLMPAEVRAMMVREMAKRGVGSAAHGAGDLRPEQMLNSDDTAVVVVEGVIPAGAPKGATFDIRVVAIPGSGTTSLEGGRLYTTELRPGPLMSGSRQAGALARARGPIFINPFIDPSGTADSIDRTTGRILDGGEATKDMPLRLRLPSTSHARAASIQSAVNSIFPREPGQNGDTARGRSGDTIELVVPPSYHDRSDEFVQLVRHTALQITAPEPTAFAVRRALLANPGQSDSATWRWRAIGPKSVSSFQDLYDHPEEGPRLAAIEAGAFLKDPLVVPHLLEMANATRGSLDTRLLAIELLGKLGYDPRIGIGLRKLLDDSLVDVRLAAFDALYERRDVAVEIFDIDGKFDLLTVPSESPLIYLTQTGTPRIVVFGDETELIRPLVFSAWQDRLLMRAEPEEQRVLVRWRARAFEPPVILEGPITLPEFIAFLGHTRTPESPLPGIGLSYAETIGVLYSLWRAKSIPGDFRAEQDRILAAIMRVSEGETLEERPEFDELEETFAPEAGRGDPVAGGAPGAPGASTGAGLRGIGGIGAPGSAADRAAVDAQQGRRDTVPR